MPLIRRRILAEWSKLKAALYQQHKGPPRSLKTKGTLSNEDGDADNDGNEQ